MVYLEPMKKQDWLNAGPRCQWTRGFKRAELPTSLGERLRKSSYFFLWVAAYEDATL